MENNNIATTSVVKELSPELLRNEIDNRIVKIRPMSSPIDQITRHVPTRRAGSMVVEYYSVDSKAYETQYVGSTIQSRSEASPVYLEMTVLDTKAFSPGETVLLADATCEEGRPVTGYINEVKDGSLCIYITSVTNSAKTPKYGFQNIPSGCRIIRMGRAARELDVMTERFMATPIKQRNYCQIFKTQIEQSTAVSLSNKEVGWTLSDQEEAAIIDMRQSMERNFLFGNMIALSIPGQDDVLLTGGIWTQAGKKVEYSSGKLDNEMLIHICREAFTGANGSSRKLLIGGTGFIEAMNKLDATRVLTAGDKVTRWGLDFTTYTSKFGTLYVLVSETFDQCGHADDAMIIDPEYITKYCHVPFNSRRLDLRSSGVRNTDAIVVTEASCVVLRYPMSHVRIICKKEKV